MKTRTVEDWITQFNLSDSNIAKAATEIAEDYIKLKKVAHCARNSLIIANDHLTRSIQLQCRRDMEKLTEALWEEPNEI